jgi:hypothetical protein
VREQPQPLGRRRDEPQGDERVEALVAAGSQPPRARHRMLGERQRVEPGALGGACDRVERA